MQKIKEVELKNFRSFAELNISDLGDVNIIVGKNNTGKSSFLEGIYLALCTKVHVINEELGSVFLPLNFIFLRRKANVVQTFQSFYDFYEVEEYKSFLRKFFQYEETKKVKISLQPINVHITISENEESLEEIKEKDILLEIEKHLKRFSFPLRIFLKYKISRKKMLKEFNNRFKQVWWLQIGNLGRFYILYRPEELLSYLEDLKIEETGISFLIQGNKLKENKKSSLFFSDAFLFCL